MKSSAHGQCKLDTGADITAISNSTFDSVPNQARLTPTKIAHFKASCSVMGDNNNELYLHDHTNTYSIAKAMFRNQNYNTGQLRYFDNNLSRTSKQAEIYFMNYILIK